MEADARVQPSAKESTLQVPLGDPRVRMAAERTLLAWIRTGLAMMGLGFVVARFGWFLRELAARDAEPARVNGGSLALGVGLVALGAATNALAAVAHARFLRRFDRGEAYRAPAWSLGVVVAMILCAAGVALAAYLVVLAA